MRQVRKEVSRTEGGRSRIRKRKGGREKKEEEMRREEYEFGVGLELGESEDSLAYLPLGHLSTNGLDDTAALVAWHIWEWWLHKKDNIYVY